MSLLRQTSPLIFEPLSPSPLEILVKDSDDDDDIDQRAAKRRRVEKLGQQYLRGQPLLISTATLRGPFNASWVNPWKRTGTPKAEVDATKQNRDRRAREDWQKQEVRREAEKIHGKIEIFPTSLYSARKAAWRGHTAVEPLVISREKALISTQPPNPFPEDIVALNETKARRRAKRHLQRERREQRATELQKVGLEQDSGHAVGLNTGSVQLQAEARGPRLSEEIEGRAIVDNRTLYAPKRERSDTPTPAARKPHTPPYQKASPPQPRSSAQSKRTTLTLAKPIEPNIQQHPPVAGPSGFTPINKRSTSIPVASPQRNAAEISGSPAGLGYSAVDCADEITLAEAEADVVEGLMRAKKLAREAALEAKRSLRRCSVIEHAERCVNDLNAGSLSPGSPSLTGTPQTLAQQDVENAKSSSKSSSVRRLLAAVEIPRRKGLTTSSPMESFGSFRELPPSTNLPAFEYRRAATAPRNPLKAGNANSKVVVKDESRRKPKMMSFASSPQSESSAPPQPVISFGSHGQAADENSGLEESNIAAAHDTSWRFVDRYTNKIITKETFNDQNGSQQPVGKQIRDIFRQSASSLHKQQSDIGQALSSNRSASHSLNDTALRSDGVSNDQSPSPAAGLLKRTGDNYRPSKTEEPRGEGMYTDLLSTQAAIAIAQRSFQAEISSPTKQPSPPSQPNDKALPISETTTANPNLSPLGFRKPFGSLRTPSPAGPTLPKLVDEEDPRSTQELLDGISPFTFSTVKKEPTVKHRASFAPSPLDVPIMSGDVNDDDTTIFGKLGYDMDTSPEEAPPQKFETSKPFRKSALKKLKTPRHSSHGASFSITPDGVLKEVYNQDGQGGRVNDTELNAMIDDVGSFLETWDVETEMRKCGAGSGSTSSLSNGTKSGFGKRVLFSGQGGK
ncbi:MAG: hypothetical protein M1812_002002 [Candelaria pacifica]|nr:MAG: hypothetical protein M1812_002002 [Candelaria pacifica]